MLLIPKDTEKLIIFAPIERLTQETVEKEERRLTEKIGLPCFLVDNILRDVELTVEVKRDLDHYARLLEEELEAVKKRSSNSPQKRDNERRSKIKAAVRFVLAFLIGVSFALALST